MGLRNRLVAPVVRRSPFARRASLDEATGRIAELEAILDHERLYPVEWAHRRIRDAFGYEVLRGPFTGLRYPQDLALRIEAFSSKLLGTYEMELHEAIEQLVQRPTSVVVNIGASDGYYAIGLARRLAGATVHAFDTNEAHHEVLRSIARENELADRVVVRGECDTAVLQELAEDALVVSDCEGCERALLDPTRVPGLQTARLLVECHDLIDPGVTDVLTDRFSSTHELELIPTRPRWVSDYQELSFLPLVTQQLAIHEFREGPMHWLVAIPR
jgi:hypothetical protein